MLWNIISKEFFDNLLKLRFVIGLVVSVILTVACVMIQANDYSQRVRDYHVNVKMQDDFIDESGPENFFFISMILNVKPEVLSPIAIGLPLDTSDSFDENFLPRLFPPIDLVFIVTIIMSLLAILFSYDAVCGEREQGTLRLMTSNSLSRATILLGKWIGGTASLQIPFIISILLGAIYVAVYPHLVWVAQAWAAFLLIILASITFISLFYLMGLMVSVFSRLSSASILNSLFLWVILILVIPNLGPYVSAQIYPIPSVASILKEYSQAQSNEYEKELGKLVAPINRRYEKEYGRMFKEYQALSSEKRMARSGMDAPESDFKTMGLKYRKEIRDAQKEFIKAMQEKLKKLKEQVELEAEKQTRIAMNLTVISPFAEYIYLTTALAGTGIECRKHLSFVSREFMKAFSEYQKEKFEEIKDAKATRSIVVKEWPMNISDRPRFSYNEEPLKDRIVGVLPYWGVLLLYGVLFFVIAYVRFIKYDVR